MILLINQVYPQVITVKQDGTGDFTIIQEAVDIANDGDTIIVYPGVYFENVDLTEKDIVLASTWLLFGQDSLISQTIIDGNQLGSCIKTKSGSEWSEVLGFSLQHGVGTKHGDLQPELYGYGGGIYISKSKLEVTRCKITDNFGMYGGGIVALESSVRFTGNNIHNNWAAGGGGGILTSNSIVEFDSIMLNSIYLNYGSFATDIAVKLNDSLQKIWLDTCTVLNPDQYYIGRFENHAIHVSRPPISVLNGMIEQVNADLFVSTSGDDSNSGLTIGDPLKTISFALLKISSDSLDPKTVYVADGVYSPSLTGEHVPIQLKNFVNLIGQSRENTIIDCEVKYEGARFAFGQDYSMAKNITFRNGNGYPTMLNGGISTGYSSKIVLDSIALINTTGDHSVGIYSDSGDSIIIKNCIFENCAGYCPVEIFTGYQSPPTYAELVSNRFSLNHPDTNAEWEFRQVTLFFVGSISTPGKIMAKVVNCLFNDNSDSTVFAPDPVPIALLALYGVFVEMANCTFANNTTTNDLGAALSLAYGSHANLYNCIFYGNSPKQATLTNTPQEPNTLGIYNSLIQDGLDGIYNNGGVNFIEWGAGNLDANPIFFGSGEHPYSIDYGSPCIDAGTTDLPPWIDLPEFDIAGNPRVYGETVDMGAYEYGPWVGVPEAHGSKFKVQSSKLLIVNPNPFSYGTYISYGLKSAGRLNISIFNSSGMLVKTLVNFKGGTEETGEIYWDGAGPGGTALPAGIYFVRLTIDGKETETVKVVKVENSH
ncbi:MAG: T9SS type A sorting domain-containing protein [Bacteroidales bacterium]|nr:T9SS type A sorting domain-containing protein [Bacteroidales bacterium]